MSNEFVIKNGLISQGNITATGSLVVSQNITASNISASGTISASVFSGAHTGSTFGTSSWSSNSLTASNLALQTSYTITNANSIAASLEVTGPANSSGSFAVLASLGDNTASVFTVYGDNSPRVQRFNVTRAGNVGIGTTNPAYKLEVVGNISCSAITASNFFGTSSWSTNALTASSLVVGNSYRITNLTASNISASSTISASNLYASGYIYPNNDIAFPWKTSGSYRGLSSDPAAGAQSVLELVHCLSNAIGVNDPLRFRTVSAPEYYSASAWFTDTNPPAYGTLIDGNASNTTQVITYNDSSSLSIGAKRFVVSFPTYSRPNFITVQSDYGNNSFYGYSIDIEKQSASVWLSAVTTQTVQNNFAYLVAFQLGDLSNTDALRFTFTSTQPISSGGALKVNSIRAYSNQYYSSTIPVYTNSSSQFISTNNVGIGSVAPKNKLDVVGNISCSVITASLFSGSLSGSVFGTSSWATNSLTASSLVAGNSYTITNLTASNISASGTGSFGYVGIGVANPVSKLHVVSGSAYFEAAGNGNSVISSGSYAIQIAPLRDRISTANSYYGGIAFNHLLNWSGGTAYNNSPQAWIGTRLIDTVGTERAALVFATKIGTSSSDIPLERMCINSTGNVGIGTTNPTNTLEVVGNISASSFSGSVFGTSSWATNALTAAFLPVGTYSITSSWATNSLTASYLTPANSYQITNLTASNISGSGTGSFNMIGVGTASPGAILEVSSSTALTVFNVKGAAGANLFTISGSGNIGVGTTPSTTYKMQINGGFSATTKSFDIEHPTKSGKRLVYGSLESPYHGVRLTGKGKLVKGKGVIQLPDYMNSLVDYETINVQITNIKHNRVIYVDDINEKNNSVSVAAKIPKTQLNKELEFYWTFTAIRKDVPNLQVEL